MTKDVLHDMNDRQPLLSSAVWYTVATVVGQGVVLISTRPFTEMMSAEEWGIVQTYLAVVLILNTIIGLNLHIGLRNSFTDFKGQTDGYASSSLFLSTLSFLAFLGVGNAAMGFANLGEWSLFIELALFQSFAVFVINFYTSKLAMEFGYKLRSVFLCLPNVAHTALSLLLIYVLKDMQAADAKVLGNAIGLGVFALAGYVAVMRRGRLLVNTGYWKYGLAISLPSIAWSLSDLVLMQSDRVMISAIVGTAETGIYSNAYNIGAILWMLSTATGGAWTPWFYRKMDEKLLADVRTCAKQYTVLFSFGACGLLLISPEILRLLTPAEYWGGEAYLAPIIFASFVMFLYAFPASALFYFKKTGVIARNSIIASVLNVALNAAFIPVLGAAAAAYSTALCYCALFFLHWFAYRKVSDDMFDARQMARCAGVVAGMAVLLALTGGIAWPRYVILSGVVTLFCIWLYRNKGDLFDAFAVSRRK
jgi:O-antigen/teichoic acid export membrane protein